MNKGFITVNDGERRVVPENVVALVRSGGAVIADNNADISLEPGAVGYVMSGADVCFLDGASVYLQINTAYLAGMDWFSVQHGLGVNDARNFYVMPDWFWQRKDWRTPARKN